VIRVVLADDQALVRAGFRMILEAQADLEVVGEAVDGRAVLSVVRRTDPDVVLMDIRMPHLDGTQATRRLVSAGSRARILMLTTFDLDDYLYEAMRAGASGFLLKTAPPHQLVAAIRDAAAGDVLVAPAITRRLIEEFVQRPRLAIHARPGLKDLTPRELEVLRLIAGGRSNAELAAELHLSEATVKTHVARILTKLQLRDRVQAVVVAYESGLVRPGSVDP
jgi:DNA-binding NarL/FixJ family response regulator